MNIILSSKDVSILDTTLGKIVDLFSLNSATVKLLPAITGEDGTLHRRSIILTQTDDKTVAKLDSITAPHGVDISIRLN